MCSLIKLQRNSIYNSTRNQIFGPGSKKGVCGTKLATAWPKFQWNEKNRENLVPRTIIKWISLYFNQWTQNEGNSSISEVNLGYSHIFVHFFFKNSGIFSKKFWYPQYCFFSIFFKKSEIVKKKLCDLPKQFKL